MRDLARRMAVPIVFAECVVSDAQAKARMAARALEPDAVSDATWEIYLQQKAAFAPFGSEFAACHLKVDGAGDASEVACRNRAIHRGELSMTVLLSTTPLVVEPARGERRLKFDE